MDVDYNNMTFDEREEFWKQKNLDGIVDKNLYAGTTPKILIIAHEPWIKENEDPLEFDLIKAIEMYGENPQKKKSALYESAEIVRKIFNLESREGVLRKVAWINVKKQPQIGSKEHRKEIQRALRINRKFIFEQINQIKPDIILAYNVIDGKNGLWEPWLRTRGRLLQYLVPNNEKDVREIASSYIDPYVEEGSDGHNLLVIDTCHPSARREVVPADTISNCVHCFICNEYTIGNSWTDRRTRRRKNKIKFAKAN